MRYYPACTAISPMPSVEGPPSRWLRPESLLPLEDTNAHQQGATHIREVKILNSARAIPGSAGISGGKKSDRGWQLANRKGPRRERIARSRLH